MWRFLRNRCYKTILMKPVLPAMVRLVMVVVDVGFLAYWAVTGLHLVPPDWLYRDAADPVLVAWNLSFLPLDLLVSATGLTALRLSGRGDPRARVLAAGSLSLTAASGLMAVAFWALRGDFEPGWGAPNLALLVAPLLVAPQLLVEPARL
jgi:hypothetical protein